MSKIAAKPSASEIEERFLLQSLRRLSNPEQRYFFTLIADLISTGLAAHKSPAGKGSAPT
jgi:hypothetical protein